MAGLIGLDSTSSGFDPGLQNPPMTFGVWGDSGEQDGVIGSSNTGVGVLGRSVGAGTGVQAISENGTGVHARRDPGGGGAGTEAFLATPSLAADFRGDVATTGVLRVGGRLGVGIGQPRRPLHVEGQEVHSGGPGAGFSFADRAATSLVESPQNGERWRWYAQGGSARLWSGTDRLTIDNSGNIGIGGGLGVGSLNVDPQGLGPDHGIVVGNPDTGGGGFTSLVIDISGARDGYGRIQAIESSGSAWGVTALNPHGGNVGIGTTAPKARLHVAGVAADIVAGNDVNGQKFIFHTRAHAGGDFLHITGDDANGDWQWHKGIIFERGMGKVTIRGDCHVTGTINKSALGFKIDHPLDPAKKFLCHSGIESDEMKNIYDGVADLDADGRAEVALPDWFEALNQDFRYQLTAIGAAAPDLHIAAELRDGRFAIAGGLPGMKVCWQVTGVRHDAYAQAHPLQVEALKSPDDAGLFLPPEAHGEFAEHSLATRFAMAAHDSEEE